MSNFRQFRFLRRRLDDRPESLRNDFEIGNGQLNTTVFFDWQTRVRLGSSIIRFRFSSGAIDLIPLVIAPRFFEMICFNYLRSTDVASKIYFCERTNGIALFSSS